MEATDNSQWFIELVEDLGHAIWIEDAAQIRARYVRKQKTPLLPSSEKIADVGERPVCPRIDSSVPGLSVESSLGTAFSSDHYCLLAINRFVGRFGELDRRDYRLPTAIPLMTTEQSFSLRTANGSEIVE